MITKVPALVQKFFPEYLWRKHGPTKQIYLTFDDGPIPVVTPWVLSCLNDFDAKATFFCLGRNVERYPELFRELYLNGHRTGNHSFDHLNGWKTDNAHYLQNIQKARDVMEKNEVQEVRKKPLFRPPYGRIRKEQASQLQEAGYEIVMWEVLSGDYNRRRSPEKCLRGLTRYTTSGSIVVFHDSLKAAENLQKILPQFLRFCREEGYRFASL